MLHLTQNYDMCTDTTSSTIKTHGHICNGTYEKVKECIRVLGTAAAVTFDTGEWMYNMCELTLRVQAPTLVLASSQCPAAVRTVVRYASLACKQVHVGLLLSVMSVSIL